MKALLLVLLPALALAQGRPPTGLRGVIVTVTYDATTVAGDFCSEQTMTVSGVRLGDAVTVQPLFSLPESVFTDGARATAANTVVVRYCNISGVDEDPPSGSYIVVAVRK